MPILDQFNLFAEYNQLMNRRLFEAAARLDERQLKSDRGAFFKSVLGTLNHILVADIIWLKRFQAHAASAPRLGYLERHEQPRSLDALLYEDLQSLKAERERIDALLIDWIAGLSESDLNASLSYRNMSGKPQCKSVESLISHVFLHQVHHRGQATTLISQSQVDFGETDLLELIDEQPA